MKLKLKKTEYPMDLDDHIAGMTVKYGCIVEEKEQYKTIICASKNVYADIISTGKQTYMMMKHHTLNATDFLKVLRTIYDSGTKLKQ